MSERAGELDEGSAPMGVEWTARVRRVGLHGHATRPRTAGRSARWKTAQTVAIVDDSELDRQLVPDKSFAGAHTPATRQTRPTLEDALP